MEDNTSTKPSPTMPLSLPELLFLVSLEKAGSILTEGVDLYALSKNTAFRSNAALSLILDIALQNMIQLKMKSSFLRGERQVIVLTDPEPTTDSKVVELMITKLKNQKHDHSVQQWADHWCGNTWSELVFPQHPTLELLKQVAQSLDLLDLVNRHGQEMEWKLCEKGLRTRDAIRETLQLWSKKETLTRSHEMNSFEIRTLLLCGLFAPEEAVNLMLSDSSTEDKVKNSALLQQLDKTLHSFLSSKVLSDDVKSIIQDIQLYQTAFKNST